MIVNPPLNNTDIINKLEHYIKFNYESIENYLKIKSVYERLVNSGLTSLEKNRESINNNKNLGTVKTEKILKEHRIWYKEQLKINKDGLDWCCSMIKTYKEETVIFEQILRKLIIETLN